MQRSTIERIRVFSSPGLPKIKASSLLRNGSENKLFVADSALGTTQKWLKHGNACIRFGSNRAIEVNLPGWPATPASHRIP